jgi:hypothetical protein
MSHPKQASKAFSHDLGATIRAYNASQLKKGMSNVQSNKQSSSGTATNQNRVIGGRGSGAISGGNLSGTGSRAGTQHFTPSRPNLVNAPGGGIHRSPLYPPAKGGPAGGKPIVGQGRDTGYHHGQIQLGDGSFVPNAHGVGQFPGFNAPASKKQAINAANPGYAEALAQLKARRGRRARAPRPYAA